MSGLPPQRTSWVAGAGSASASFVARDARNRFLTTVPFSGPALPDLASPRSNEWFAPVAYPSSREKDAVVIRPLLLEPGSTTRADMLPELASFHVYSKCDPQLDPVNSSLLPEILPRWNRQ